MNEATINRLQDEANSAYNHLDARESAGYLQATLLAEIALQLKHHNDQVAILVNLLDSFRVNGFPVERV